MSRSWSSNDWPAAWVDPDHDPPAWSLEMSVVVPAYGGQEQLEVLLEALSQQTYPRELTEVIVVDDGSEPALHPRLPDDLAVRLLRQERDGFGPGRARNLGVQAAQGDVVVFLDADMLPEAGWLESHARPHHHSTPLVGVGPRTHVSRLEVTMEEITSGKTIGEILASADPARPEWLLERWRSTEDGRIGDDVWWVTSGGNLSVTRGLFLRVGGFDESGFREWGGEDNELGYRLYQAGAWVVPVHSAMAWHLGPATNEAADIEERRRRIKIRLASRIASSSLPRLEGVAFPVPDVLVRIARSCESFEAGAELVASVLSDSDQAAIRIVIGASDPDEERLLADYFAGDSRVEAGPSRQALFAPITVDWPHHHWPRGLAHWLTSNIGEGGVGVIDIPSPEGTARAWLTRLLNRIAAGLCSEEELTSRFGRREVAWETLLNELAEESAKEAERWRRKAQLDALLLAELSQRRSIRLANSLGSLLQARSWSELRRSLKVLGTALRPGG